MSILKRNVCGRRWSVARSMRYDDGMKPTIVICGYGSGISHAVAHKFGQQGLAVALVARTETRVSAAATALGEAGITARGFAADLGDPEAVRKLIADVQASLGPIAVVHWNAYSFGAGDLTTASSAELRGTLDVSVTGLVAAVQASLSDLKAQSGSVLVTGGGLSFYDSKIDAMGVQWGAMGLSIAKAAQHKAVGVLHHRLKGEGIYVGEVVVMGAVKGTTFDSGQATIEASAVGDKFWELHQSRSESTVNLS